MALLEAKAIPNPYIGLAEQKVQWVMECDWIYETMFENPGGRIRLVLEGLDTFCAVLLNGEHILESSNMFHHHEIDVNLQQGTNTLQLRFDSTSRRGNELLAKDVLKHRVTWNGHYFRSMVRHAQYLSGWDWGPALVTCGPWKPIYLLKYNALLTDLRLTTSLDNWLKRGTLRAQATVHGAETAKLHVEDIGEASGKISDGSIDLVLSGDVELWWPNGYGKQTLYNVILELYDQDGEIIYTERKRIGFRKIELVQEKFASDIGTSFYFRVNHVPIFAGGANWVPADNFLPSISRERYFRWLELVRKGNQCMLRVWGGGIYESDDFYDAADEMGILVWQDFCFACGQYPADDAFCKSIEREARDNLRRIRHRASLAILCGNNEDYQVGDDALHYDHQLPESKWLDSDFPARIIYERLLPRIVSEECDWIAYHPGSPWGGINSSDKSVGDVHQWHVWGGVLAPYQVYGKIGGRFVSEFGMIAMPNLNTVKENFFDADYEDHHPQSLACTHHMKAHSYEKRMGSYLGENIRFSFDLDKYVYATQFIQAEANAYAYRDWRRQWCGDGKRYCGGALTWQIDDSWPVTSWGVVDWHLRPKPAYFAIKREMSATTVGISRDTTKSKPNSKVEALCNSTTVANTSASLHSTPHLYPPKQSTIDIWSVNSTQEIVEAKLITKAFLISDGSEVSISLPSERCVEVKANGCTELHERIPVPADRPVVVFAWLLNSAGKVLGCTADWPQPFRDYTFPQRDVSVKYERNAIYISVARPVKGLTFMYDDSVSLSNNFIDVAPGHVAMILVEGLKEGKQLEYTWYGKDD